MSKKLLDLFCKAGGCSKGYHDAGFEVVGVDIEPQPNYPYTFIQADALTLPLSFLKQFDVIHASPKCQGYSSLNNTWKNEYEKQIPQVKAMLMKTSKIWIIENVEGAPLPASLLLCGTMFNLKVLRHRLFESNVFLPSPSMCRHKGTVKNRDYMAVYGHEQGKLEDIRLAMGISWMNRQELNQAIPPKYTQWIGEQVIQYYL